jgi:hypothetical protein
VVGLELTGDLRDGSPSCGRVPLNICARSVLEAAKRNPAERVRSGSLLVLCGWALFVIAGSAFAKMTEQWVGATPQGSAI